ncbi:MAG: M48 family metalloprotease [Myxococcales bacterium]|nr:M48 family metalloprotease [Myxococcales bacterium]
MIRAPLAPLATMLALLLVAGCQTSINPVTGRRQVVLMSEADERQIDAAVAPQIEQSEGLVRDRELNAYVDGVGQSLAAHSKRKDVLYSFQIIESEVPNAFALPGGHIYISRGLLTVANSEAELANVLGHEIGHVAARHAAQQDAHAKTLGLSTLLGDIMSGGAEALPDSESISGHFIARYARNQEREADRIGQDLSLEAGVDPSGMARFLQKLQNLDKLSSGFSSPQSYLATHPALPERVAEATTNAQVREWRAEITRDPLSARAPLTLGAKRDLYLDHIEGIPVGRPASEGIFEEDHFLHPELNFSLRFPTDWHHINQSSQVVGLAPTRDGVVLVQVHGTGDDPLATARKFAAAEGLRLEKLTPLKIGDLPALRAQTDLDTSFGHIDAEITWIAHEGRIYALIAGTQPGGVRKYQGIFRRFAQSFRPLGAEDRAAITELRLRTARSRAGETLAELSERTGNEWDLTFTAIVNDLFVDDRLAADRRIKIAVREPYEAARRSTAPSPSAQR